MTDSPKKDFNPKHRVVGAIVLVALAVIVLPLILHRGEGDLPGQGDAVAPMAENQVFVADLTRTDTIADSPPAAPAAPAVTAPAPPVAAPVPPAAAMPKESPTPTTVPGPKTQAPAPPVSVSANKGFYVQVGTFGSRANARQLADKLKQHGYRVQLEQVRLASGDALRVRVGPYAQDAQAQAARTAIKRNLDVQGIVRAY